jgi:hypothetical protein
MDLETIGKSRIPIIELFCTITNGLVFFRYMICQVIIVIFIYLMKNGLLTTHKLIYLMKNSLFNHPYNLEYPDE